jgi:hypothetical protein
VYFSRVLARGGSGALLVGRGLGGCGAYWGRFPCTHRIQIHSILYAIPCFCFGLSLRVFKIKQVLLLKKYKLLLFLYAL